MLTLLFLGDDCYYVDLPMKSAKIMTSEHCRSLVINLLLFGLLFSSVASQHGKIQARQTEETPRPTFIRAAETVPRNHALTSSPGKRVNSDISKQSRGKHPFIYYGVAPARVSASLALLSRRTVTTDRSFLYRSFRSFRPGGRAPPASA